MPEVCYCDHDTNGRLTRIYATGRCSTKSKASNFRSNCATVNDKLPGLAIRVIGSSVKDIGMKDRPPGYTPKTVRE